VAKEKRETKHYYWLKLPDNFFNSLPIKKLRKIAGGDTFTIIYLKVLLLSIKNNGYITFTHVEDNFVEELALILDEDPDNINVTLSFLEKNGLIEEVEVDNYYFKQAGENIGRETESAKRVREYRERQKLEKRNIKMLESPKNATFSDSALHCNADVTGCNKSVTTDIEIDIDNRDDDEDEEKEAQSVDNSVNKLVDNFSSEILNYLGKNRPATKAEKDMLDKWMLDWGMDTGIIRYVLKNRTASANNPSFQYMNTVLENLYKQNIFTAKDAEEYYKKRDEQKRMNNMLRWEDG